MVADAVYKRGQVECALWRYFAFHGSGGPIIPPVFRTRLKRLLELDRARDSAKHSDIPHARYAFFDEDPEGQGTDVPYTLFHTVSLAWGLELLDTGFKQWEVVFLLRHLRSHLYRTFQHILRNPPIPRSTPAASARPNCPSVVHAKGQLAADCRVFAVLQKVEFTEVFPAAKQRGTKRKPFILTPVFCHGIAELTEELHQINWTDYNYRKALVLELAHTVVLIQRFLQEAPVLPRGRK